MAQSVFLIPLTNTPQQFEISLANINYIMTCKFNDASEGGWTLDLADQLSGLPIATNLPLITGGDVLAGLGYLGVGGTMYVYTDGDDFAVPTLTNLGVESNLYFVVEVA